MEQEKPMNDNADFAPKWLLKTIKTIWGFFLLFLLFSFFSFVFFYLLKWLVFNGKLLPLTTQSELTELFHLQLTSLFSIILSVLILKFSLFRNSLKIDLSLKNAPYLMLGGFLFILGIYLIGYLISLSFGWIQIVNIKWDFIALGSSFLIFLVVAFSEEIIFRGVIQPLLLDIPLPKPIALLITSLLFMLAHLNNPGLDWIPLLNLFLAGVFFGTYMLYNQNLWFPIIGHLFWNWIQGPILGYKVSGLSIGTPLIQIKEVGPPWITGGNFGFEGSILCSILLLIATSLTYCYCKKREFIEEHQS